MSLIRETERLGAMAARRELPHEEAVHRLQQYSDGALTRLDAEDAIDRWRAGNRSRGRPA